MSFFSGEEENTSTPKADALFIPRENPRALVIRPVEQWYGKVSAEKLKEKNVSSPAQANGKISLLLFSFRKRVANMGTKVNEPENIVVEC